ncbi:serine--tRNA ligase [Candidatus Amarolinea aalborgensis]|jgi:seryl-tRNA synthetase|uniref:serine--tRNA ligase n=1 Tax=Candidatus Amarolinea aalborgensis TaxID=2249329 RepID=UPI003BF992A6
MLDIRFIRDNLEMVKQAMQDLQAFDAPVDRALALDDERREILVELENLRARRNTDSRRIGQLLREGQPEAAAALKAELADLPNGIKALEERLAQVDPALRDALLRIPNLPLPQVPVGKDDSENLVSRVEGQPRAFDFTPRPHWEIGEALGILDFERGVKLSGSRFYVLKGLGARLQRALITWMLDVHIMDHGYTEIYPPYMVKAECLVGTGNLPKFADNLYHDAEEDYWLIPTAEVPVTNLYRDEILPPGALPIYHVAYTPCFRREKMSAGRDVRGIKRGHQFDKVEMVKFVEPEQGEAELQKLIDNAEDIARRLQIPHRIIQMCTGDLAFSAAAKYDVELWAPGVNEWLEVSSCSLFTDFQARRANIRYRPDVNSKPRHVYTLNGSGLALPRVLIAVLENYQQADGSVVVPDVLLPYMGGAEVIR